MIRPININLNAAHPELPLVEATTFVGAPSSVFIRGVPKAVGNWSITAVSVAATYPDNTTTARAAVESAEGVWVATIPGTATSGRTVAGFKIMADGIDENGAAVTGYVLGFADFSVLSFTPVPAPGGTFYLLRYFDQAPATPKEGDVAKIDGVLKFYNGSAWEPFVTFDNTVTRTSANGVKSSGIWSAIWGALASLPKGFSSLYDWVVSQLAGKQSTLSAQQLANIAAVSDALAFDATHSYAAGDPVVYNGTLYTFTAAHTGAWTGSDVSAVDIIARLALKANDNAVVKLTGGQTIGGVKSFVDGVHIRLNRTDSDFQIEDPSGNLGTFTITNSMTTGRWCFFARYLDNSTCLASLPVNSGTLARMEDLAPDFSDSATYAVNALCIHEGVLYRCSTAVTTAGVWTGSTNWTEATVEDVLAALRTGKQDALSAQQLANIAAVPSKANASDLPYSLGTPIVIDTASSETVEGETVYYGAATLANRTANIVQVTAATALDELRITFPAATSGKMRDFGLRVEIGTGSAALAAPALVPVAPTGETIKTENANRAIPELADGTATAKGVTLLYFSENAPGVFVVKGEQVEEVA